MAYQCAFRRSGILQAPSLEAPFDYAQIFSYQTLLAGRRIAVITNAGLSFASISEAMRSQLREFLPAAANVHKSDARGVKVNLAGPAQVRDAYELMMMRIKQAEPSARLQGDLRRGAARRLVPARPDHRRRGARDARGLFCSLSQQSLYHRFFSVPKSLPHDKAMSFVNVDYDKDMTIVATSEEMSGVAFLVRDDW